MDRLKLTVTTILSLIAVLAPNFWVRWIVVVLLGFSLVFMLFWSVQVPSSIHEGGGVPQERDEFKSVTKMIASSKKYEVSRKLLRDYVAEAYALMSGGDPNLEYRRLMENPNKALRLLSDSQGSDFLNNLREALDVLEEDINWRG